ncbi:MAG TPA: CPBP family glutamic-type intramembrane protease [Gemmatimonadales bacterium]|nr:CPBP family glutamic-type intramembrane protease [Gemmatimonadales bacterium]
MSSPTTAQAAPELARAPSGRVRDAMEVITVLALMYAVRLLAHRLGLTFGVGAVSIVAGLALATWLLAREGESWRSLGWRRPPSIGAAAAWTIGTFLVLIAVLPALLQPIAAALGLPPQHLERLGDLRGDLTRFLILLLPLGWGTAAFGEEMLFRGYFNTRLARAFGGGRVALAAAAVGQAALFGLVHLYLGPKGVLNAFAIGLVSAAVYAANGRNLWPLILAHGLVDTVGLTALRLGLPHVG